MGTLVAGVVEGATPELAALTASIGFFAILALPILFVGGLVVRGLVRAWRPRALVERLVEEEGGAPRLVGWLVMLVLGCAVVAVIVYRGTWMIAESSDFQPMLVGFIEPVIAVVAAAIVFAASRPLVDVFASAARSLDRRWRRNDRGTLLRPRSVVIAAAVAIVLAAAVVWFGFVKPRLGPFDTSIVYAPLLAIAVTAIAQVGYARVPRRLLVGIAAGALAVGAIGFALVARVTRPSLAIEIWGDRPLAGAAVDAIYDIDEIRADISLAEFRPVDRAGAEHPDIVLVTIDTMRADHTPPYGGGAAMPVLGGLGERGAVFEWAFAPSNVTRRSIPSMVIGYAPNRIRGRVVGWALRVDPRFVLLAERLAAGGYETAGFMCCAGFWGSEAHTGLQRGIEHLVIEHDGKQLGVLARRWLQGREAGQGPRKPLFVWAHILEPHNWTHGGNSPTTKESRDQLYDRSLAQADAILAQILEPFGNRPPERAPIVIVTADHGEALGDHGQPFHSTDLYNAQLRVPFVLAGPG
nr:sulfatase-like hydrolase/transferase [Deltaproteobacteria bacterium]